MCDDSSLNGWTTCKAWLETALLAVNGWRVPLWSIAVAATATVLVWPYLGSDTLYPEFVIGQHSWLMQNKQRDIHAFYLFVGLAVALYVLWAVFLGRAFTKKRLSLSGRNALLDIGFLLLAPWCGLLFVDTPEWKPWAWMASLGWTALFAGAFLFRRSVSSDSNEESLIYRLVGSVIFGFFSGLAGALSFSQVMPTGGYALKPIMYALSFGPSLLVALTAAGLVWHSSSNDQLQRRLIFLLLAAQAALPLLLFSLLPPRLLVDGEPVEYVWPVALCLVLMIYVLLAWGDLIRRLRKVRGSCGEPPSTMGLSPWCLACIAVFLVAGRPMAAFLWGDDFHMGDELVPWQEWIQYGKVPYVDFAPFHGFMHLMSGSLNELFYHGDLAGHYHARKVLFALPVGLTYAALHRFGGARVALFCAWFALPMSFYMGRLLWLAPPFLWLALPSLMRSPMRWIIAWVTACSGAVLYNAVAGAAFGMASFPFAVWQTWRLWRTSRRGLYTVAGGCALLAGLVLLIPVTREILFGYLQFMKENSLAYAAVRGIAWEAGFGHVPHATGPFSSSLFFEAMRIAWVPILLFIIFLFLHGVTVDRSKRTVSNLYLAMGMVGMLLSLVMYSLRRMDVGDLSRTGSISYLTVAVFLPLAMVRFIPKFRMAMLLPVAFFLGLYASLLGFGDRLNPQALFWRTFRMVDIPQDMKYVDPSTSDLEFLEGTVVKPERYETMHAFRKALEELLPEGATYYDLTNRKLFYYVTNKAVPARYDAEASAVNSIQQTTIVHTLQTAPPPVVFISPIWISDHRSNLRSYHIFRHVLLNYTPVVRGPFTFMVNADSPGYPNTLNLEENMRLLGSIFSYYDLKRIPIAWGRSWKTLEQQARFVAKANATMLKAGQDGLIRVPVPPAVASGQDADLLVLEVARHGEALEADVELTWRSEPDALPEPVRFRARDGKLVVPLGSFPEWLLAVRIHELSLRLSGDYELASVEWWARTDGPSTYVMTPTGEAQ